MKARSWLPEADSIVLDVKTGNGAFMKTLDESICLAKKMVSHWMHGRAQMPRADYQYGYPAGIRHRQFLEMTEAIRT